MAENVTCITNHTMTLLCLPSYPGCAREFPEGVKLIPGLNRVSNKYLDAMRDYAVGTIGVDGKPKGKEVAYEDVVEGEDDKGEKVNVKVKKLRFEPIVRYPGREALHSLANTNVRIVNSSGKHFGPRITIHDVGAISDDVPNGPPPPLDLPEKETNAIRMVEQTTQKDALYRWAQTDPREAVKQAIQRQLGGL